jgi:hypothetical protein
MHRSANQGSLQTPAGRSTLANVKASKRVTQVFGLELSRNERLALRQVSVFATSRIRLITQSSGRRLLHGDESGGGAKDLGHYCGYTREDGEQFTIVNDLPTLDRNGLHRSVFAPSLVRYELFRYNTNNVHFLVTLHTIDNIGSIRTKVLFAGNHGLITPQGATFFSPVTAEEIQVPESLMVGYRASLTGARKLACVRAYFADLRPFGAGALKDVPALAVEPASTSTSVSN